MGSSNNAQQQNAAANAQIAGNTKTAQTNLAQWLAQNPSILSQAPQGINPAPQFGGSFGGGVQGPGNSMAMRQPPGMQPGGMPQAPQMPRVMPQGGPPQAAPQGAPGGAQRTPQAQIPPGLLGLLQPRAPGQ